ncbi:Hypothetical predicted protein [Paramuricea clavata]|uniref:Uncharacterized protein n=1 Tax=Paramuricea clavata TaxID=317549 RepID=A0A6S7HQ07_PARCT|nr:Hypothetical predicted protein [Paramuricea clavata]
MDDLAQTPKSSKSDTDTQSKKRKRQLEKLDESQLEESHIDEPANFVIANTEMESLRETNRRLKNKIISLKTSAKGNKSKMKLMRRRVLQLEQRLEEQSVEKSAEESEMEGGNIENDVDMEEDDEDFIEEDIGLLQHNGNLRFCYFSTFAIHAKLIIHWWKKPQHEGFRGGGMTVLFPTIFLHWKKYQSLLLEKAKKLRNGVVLAGDGQHDSMGHSAKFCAYTIFCCTLAQIIHFNLVQRNQAGSSPAMEFMSFKLSMDYLINYGLTITTFISDRHTSIAKYMRTVLKQIIHYFDVWHLKKKIRKWLTIATCREKKTNPDKSERIKVSYPKFKNGEATIRSVRVAQNFDYVQEIYETFLSATEKDLKSKEAELKQMCPPCYEHNAK